MLVQPLLKPVQRLQQLLRHLLLLWLPQPQQSRGPMTAPCMMKGLSLQYCWMAPLCHSCLMSFCQMCSLAMVPRPLQCALRLQALAVTI